MDEEKPAPGWYARLAGDSVDLDDWRHSLNEPFDPVALKFPDGETVLSSKEFADVPTASEVRERALGLIGRMNGALSLWNGARPIRFAGVYRVDEEGKCHAILFAEAAIELNRCVMRATAVILGPDGQPLPPSPPTPSKPQDWNQLASSSEDISDLLEHVGRADNWFDIYKTIELAERIAGNERKLVKLLAGSGVDVKRLKRSANFYRHARARRPENPFNLAEARSMISYVAQRVLEQIPTAGLWTK